MNEIPISLVLQAREGDQAACGEIIEALKGPLMATAYRFLGSRFLGEIEDVTQDIFLKIFRGLDSFDPHRGVRFTTWVYSLARNHCFDVLKKRRFHEGFMREDQPLPREILDAYTAPEPSPGFARNVLAHVEAGGGGALPRALLEQYTAPEPSPELAERVLAVLAAEGTAVAPQRRVGRRRVGRRRTGGLAGALLAAAAVLATLLLLPTPREAPAAPDAGPAAQASTLLVSPHLASLGELPLPVPPPPGIEVFLGSTMAGGEGR